MTFSIELPDDTSDCLQLQDTLNEGFQARIKVVGIGGAGGNALNTMISYGLEGVEFLAVNTDIQALKVNAAPTRIAIGQSITRGLGAGANPEKGRKAALEDIQRIKEYLSGADMVFIAAGMGGGTGTGAAPVIAQIAREEGALCVAVVTKPFHFEGKRRSATAALGLEALTEHVDTIITIPNQKLLAMSDEELTFTEACHKADEVLYQAVNGITELIQRTGWVNVDFADVKTIMSNNGRAIMGTGCAKGDDRARLAAEIAISSPLLDDISVQGATAVLVNITGGTDLKIGEVDNAVSFIQEQAHENANIIFGAAQYESMADMLKVTVVATGFNREDEDDMMVQTSQQSVPISVPQPVATSKVSTQVPSSRPTLISEDARLLHRKSVPPIRSHVTVTNAVRTASASSQTSSFFDASETDWDIPAYTRRGGKQ